MLTLDAKLASQKTAIERVESLGDEVARLRAEKEYLYEHLIAMERTQDRLRERVTELEADIADMEGRSLVSRLVGR
ncbi:hypothetical protein [Halospeciosus flavus]